MVDGDGAAGHAGAGGPGSDGNQEFVGQFHHFRHFFRGAGEHHHFRFLEEMGVPFFVRLVLFQIFLIGLYIAVAHHFFQFFHQFRCNRIILMFHSKAFFPLFCKLFLFPSFAR